MYISKNIQKACLKLFSAFLTDRTPSGKLYCNEELAKYGVIIDEILKAKAKKVLSVFLSVYNLDKINNTFYTFYQTATTDVILRIFEQILHYYTTYGKYGEVGKVDIKDVYIPNKTYGEIPEGVLESVKLITAITPEMLKERILWFFDADIGVSDEIRQHLFELIEFLVRKSYLSSKDFDKDFKNRDLKAMIFEYFSWLPSDPEELLRVILAPTHIKIKSKEVLDYLATSEKAKNKFLTWMSEVDNPAEKLAKVWRRNREYFLMLKKNLKYDGEDEAIYIINKARRLADRLYQPIYCKRILDYSYSEFKSLVKSGRISNLVKYYNYLAFIRKVGEIEKEVNTYYIIRNGKVWFNTISYRKIEVADYHNLVVDELRKRMSKVFQKTVKLYKNERIAIPSSLKQVYGNIPLFSRFIFENKAIIGIHWYDLKYQRVDLDLHIQTLKGKRIGWCYDWGDNNILFSGDMTSAPLPSGATELMYVKSMKNPLLFTVAKFNLLGSTVIPFTLIVGDTRKNFYKEDKLLTLKDICLAIPTQTPLKKNFLLGVLYRNEEKKKEFIIMICGVGVTSVPAFSVEDKINAMLNKGLVSLTLDKIVDYEFVDTPKEADIALCKISPDWWEELLEERVENKCLL